MEGPSLVILREELEPLCGETVLKAEGNTKQPKEKLQGCRLQRVDTWGKQLFLTFAAPRSRRPIVTRTHFLMFGSYRINDPRPERFPRLQLKFKSGVVYFYACSIQFDAEEYLGTLDRRVDLMSNLWDRNHVVRLMSQKEEALLCDLFLEQSVFAGSGNIVKNEVLFNIRLHPLTKLRQVPGKDWPRLADAVHEYCWNFFAWKKKFELRKHWQVYRQTKCPLCNTKLVKQKLGRFSRTTFYCPEHQAFHQRIRRLQCFPVLPVAGLSHPDARLDH